jgi:hypothetical protein
MATTAAGTVTSVGLSAPSFLSVSGSPVTSSGTLALTYSGTALPVVNGGTGTTTPNLVAGTNVSITGTWPNQTINSTNSGGTVTSVTATSPVASTGGTTPVISIPAATTSVSGYLTNTDWNTFNNKGSGTVTSVTGTAPVVSSGGATPAISMAAATSSVSGYLTSTDWTTFNSKGSGSVTSVAATVPSFLSVSGSPITSSGTLAISYSGTALPVANGGTGTSTPSLVAGTNVTISGTWPNQTINSTASGGGSGTVTSVAATVPSFLSVTGSPITTTGTLAIAYSGTALPVANGGTGVTASSGANSVVLRDANQNISANAIDDGYLNTTASGTTITLTAGSIRRYTINGSGGQVIKLPDATTLANGAIFEFDNNQTSGAITVNNNSNTLVVSVPSGGILRVDLLSNATAAGSWDKHSLTPASVSWSTNTFDYAGSITSATWNGATIAYNRGGTGQASNFVAGGVVYGSTTTAMAVTAAGTSGQVLTSAGAGIPTWTTPTTGTVTSVSGTGTVNGISLSGTVTSSGNLTLGGTLDLSSPPAIGGTSPAAGSFTTLTGTTSVTTPIVQNSAAADIAFKTNSATSAITQFNVFHIASAVNYVQVTGGTAGNPPVISAQGATTPDLDLTLTPKGAGRVNITTSIKPKVSSAASVTSPLAWNSTSFDEYAITALANALTINADANASPADGQKMMFRFKDNGTARALTWTTGSTNSFRVVGVTLPTTTVASKLVYVGCVYNAADSRWDAVAVSQEA